MPVPELRPGLRLEPEPVAEHHVVHVVVVVTDAAGSSSASSSSGVMSALHAQVRRDEFQVCGVGQRQQRGLQAFQLARGADPARRVYARLGCP